MAEHSNIPVTVKSNSILQTESETSSSVTNNTEQNDKAYIPILLYDSTTQGIPSNLQLLVENLNNNGGSDTNKSDLLVSAFFVLMIETGFIPINSLDMFHSENIDFNIDRVLTFINFPEEWKNVSSNTYRIHFALQPFPSYTCKMTCISMNTNLIVNLVVQNIGTFTNQFYVNKYVPCDYCKKIRLKYRHLDELSIEFKNSISLPAKYAILREEDVASASLQDMPTEIFLKIFLKLDVVSFCRLIQTCKRIRECAKFYEHNVWKYYFEKEFAGVSNAASDSGWMKMYKDELAKRRKSEKIRRQFHASRNFHDFF